MFIPTKKLKNGFEIPIIGLGTARLIGEKDDEGNSDDHTDIKAIKNAIKMGINHIDTAELYGDGHAEELVAQAIQDIPRNELFITSKVHSPHLTYEGVMASARKSLDRLKIDHFDLYLVHQPDLEVPISETMKAMDELVDMGLTKYIGVSNFNVTRLIEAQKYAKHKLVLNQVHYNLEIREAQRIGLVEYCQKNDIILSAWRPLQKGTFLTKNIDILNEMCQKYNKTPAQISLNWLISQMNVIAVCKTRNIEHLKDNLGALDWQMDKEDIERLDKEFPNQQDTSDRFPLP